MITEIICHCEPEYSEGVAISEFLPPSTEIATSSFRIRTPRNDNI